MIDDDSPRIACEWTSNTFGYDVDYRLVHTGAEYQLQSRKRGNIGYDVDYRLVGNIACKWHAVVSEDVVMILGDRLTQVAEHRKTFDSVQRVIQHVAIAEEVANHVAVIADLHTQINSQDESYNLALDDVSSVIQDGWNITDNATLSSVNALLDQIHALRRVRGE